MSLSELDFPWTTIGLFLSLAVVFVFFYLYLSSEKYRKFLVHKIKKQKNFIELFSQAIVVWKEGSPQPAFISPQLASLFKINTRQVKEFGKIFDFFTPRDAQVLRSFIKELLLSGHPFMDTFTLPAIGKVMDVTGHRYHRQDLSAPLYVVTFSDNRGQAQRERHLQHQIEQISEQYQHLRELFNSLPIPLWQRDKKGIIVNCNNAYVRAVESETTQEVISKGLEIARNILGRDGKAMAREVISSFSPQHQVQHVVVSGTRRLMDIHEIPLIKDDKVVATIGFGLDITEIEDAQNELNRHVDAHREVLERLSLAIALFGPDSKLKFFNAAYANLWGLDPEWLATEPDFAQILEVKRTNRRLPEHADFPSYKQNQLKLFTTLIESQEDILHLPDDTTLRRIISPHPFGGLLFTYEDVTATLALERSYNTLKEVERETINALHDGIAVFGPDGRLKLCNPTFQNIGGLETEDFTQDQTHIGQILEHVRDEIPDDETWIAFNQEIVGGIVDHAHRHFTLEHKNHALYDYETVPLPDGNVMMAIVDVTDKVRAEYALIERNEALIAADRIKTAFLENISYEFRTPLNTIIGFSELLTAGYFGALNNRQVDYVDGILTSSKHLLRLIDDVLDLASFEFGYQNAEFKEFDLQPILRDLLNTSQTLANPKNIQIDFTVPETLPLMFGDQERLKQAFLHLIKNAIQFSPPNGTIKIDVKTENKQIIVTLEDFSTLPTAEALAALFEKGTTQETSNGRQSISVGLPLVRNVLEHHGGALDILTGINKKPQIRCVLPSSQSLLQKKTKSRAKKQKAAAA